MLQTGSKVHHTAAASWKHTSFYASSAGVCFRTARKFTTLPEPISYAVASHLLIRSRLYMWSAHVQLCCLSDVYVVVHSVDSLLWLTQVLQIYFRGQLEVSPCTRIESNRDRSHPLHQIIVHSSAFKIKLVGLGQISLTNLLAAEQTRGAHV